MFQATFVVDKDLFLVKALHWAQQFKSCCLLHSNNYEDIFSNISCVLTISGEAEFVSDGENTFEKIEKFKTNYPDRWIVGFFSYDLKNEIENLSTGFSNPLAFPEAYFFASSTTILFKNEEIEIWSESDPNDIFESILSFAVPTKTDTILNDFKKKITKEAYFDAFENLQNHIKRGDIYEVNLCQEFYAKSAVIDPVKVYWDLNTVSPTPFSTFFKLDDKYILSASPERFLAKRSETLISQPIKGTAPRGKSDDEDEIIKAQLVSNPKEIAENVMIVDLVRNDLTKSAKPGSVGAERKLEVHTFKQVHQLVSTITCQINPNITDLEAIKQAFPAGSMTGAPKIRAMELCDQYEASKRGIYAGAVGYFAPNGDFDFNVIIRTLLYNQTKQYLSFHTGGAITINSEAEQEYKECLLKAKGILRALDVTLS